MNRIGALLMVLILLSFISLIEQQAIYIQMKTQKNEKLRKYLVICKANIEWDKLIKIRKSFYRELEKYKDLETIDLILDNYRKSIYNTFIVDNKEIFSELTQIVENNGGKVAHYLHTISSISIYANNEILAQLKKHPYVWRIVPVPKLRINMDTATKSIYADSFWNDGYSGASDIGDSKSGIEVAVVDTGVDMDCTYLSGRIVDAESFVAGESEDDLNDHGTMVANIIASDHPTYKGVAYGANIINAKAMNQNGEGDMDDVMAAIEWAITQASDTAEIINLSLGAPKDVSEGLIPDGNSVITRYIDYLSYIYDVLPVVAVGNYEVGYKGVNIPGDLFNGLSVGALYDYNTIDRSDDALWDESCYGPTDDGRIKPDVVAPGQGITTITRGNGIRSGTGTSFSTPMVSGSCALIIEYLIKNLGYKGGISLLTKALLINSADFWSDSSSGPGDSVTNKTGFGYINLMNARDWIGNVRLVHLIMGNTKKYRVSLGAGENLFLSVVWWRVPSGELEFYKIGKFKLEIYNSSGSKVFEATSTCDNVMKIKFSPSTSGEYLIAITKLNETDSPLIDDIAIASSKPLSTELGILAVEPDSPLMLNDSERSFGKLIVRNFAEDAIEDISINIECNKISFWGVPFEIQSIGPGEKIEIDLNGSIKGAGVGFVLVTTTYRYNNTIYKDYNGTVMIIHDDDTEEPEVYSVRVWASMIRRKIIVEVNATDNSGISNVSFYWRIKYPVDELRLDLADGKIELSYDESKGLWVGEIPLSTEWDNQKFYFVIIVIDADTDWAGDQLETYYRGHIELGSLKLFYALIAILAILIVLSTLNVIRKKKQ